MLIREANKGDIEAIVKLYSPCERTNEFEWFFSDPFCGKLFRSFVAVTEDNMVVGHIGGIVSRYQYNNMESSGVQPILWMVSSDYRGKEIGSELMAKVSSCADFAFIIGGCRLAQRIVPSLSFKWRFHIHEFSRLITPLDYFKSLDNIFSRKIVRTIFFLSSFIKRKIFRLHGHSASKVTLEEYKEGQITQVRLADSVFYNLEEKCHINFLLTCPLLDAHIFTIKQNNSFIGLVICYIDKNKKNIKVGRIVHLSYLGDDLTVWHDALSKIEQFFKDRGCVMISTLATHSTYIKSLRDSGYISTRNSVMPFFIRDPKKILANITDESWHLTFFEGDLGYRGIIS